MPSGILCNATANAVVKFLTKRLLVFFWLIDKLSAPLFSTFLFIISYFVNFVYTSPEVILLINKIIKMPARIPKNTVKKLAFSFALGSKSKKTTASIKPLAKLSAYLTYFSSLFCIKIANNAPKINPKKANTIANTLSILIQ